MTSQKSAGRTLPLTATVARARQVGRKEVKARAGGAILKTGRSETGRDIDPFPARSEVKR